MGLLMLHSLTGCRVLQLLRLTRSDLFDDRYFLQLWLLRLRG